MLNDQCTVCQFVSLLHDKDLNTKATILHKQIHMKSMSEMHSHLGPFY